MGVGGRYTGARRARTQFPRDLVRHEDADLRASAATMCAAVPSHAKVLGPRLREAHARWCNAPTNGNRGNPLFQLRQLLRAMKAARMPLYQAMLLVHDVEAFALTLWSEGVDTGDAAVVDAMHAENAAQYAADRAGLDMAAGRVDAAHMLPTLDAHAAQLAQLRMILNKRTEVHA